MKAGYLVVGYPCNIQIRIALWPHLRDRPATLIADSTARQIPVQLFQRLALRKRRSDRLGTLVTKYAIETHALQRHGHSIMHCKAPVWAKPGLGEAQLGHQAPAEYKLRLFLGPSDLYFGPCYSAGSETLRNKTVCTSYILPPPLEFSRSLFLARAAEIDPLLCAMHAMCCVALCWSVVWRRGLPFAR
jgi:hypothetical protein